MKKTIIVVDMQNDFVTGSLGTKEACKTVPVIEKLLKENQENQIIFTQDKIMRIIFQRMKEKCYLLSIA